VGSRPAGPFRLPAAPAQDTAPIQDTVPAQDTVPPFADGCPPARRPGTAGPADGEKVSSPRAEETRVVRCRPSSSGQLSRSLRPWASVPPLTRIMMPSTSGQMAPAPQVSQVAAIWPMAMPVCPV
jgi:hypothetical protein